jgi:hypothetical protein
MTATSSSSAIRRCERLSQLSQAAGADGVINTHIFVDGIGTPAVVRYYAMFDECLKAAAERPLIPVDFSKFTRP